MNRKVGASLVLFSLASLGALSGCGNSGPAAVSGKVTKDGAPLTTGVITFHSPDGKKAVTGIGGDGSYKFVNPPNGKVTVTVEVAEMKPIPGLALKSRPVDKLNMMSPANTGVRVQSKYRSKNTSDLQFTLTGSHQSLDIQLQ